MNRLKTDGLKFDGTNELQLLEKILGLGKTALKGDPRSVFLGLYKDGANMAIGGLQVIDNEKYNRYKEARVGGATHDEAWTFTGAGDTPRRRYELERLRDLAK